jgi:hypothetical protein
MENAELVLAHLLGRSEDESTLYVWGADIAQSDVVKFKSIGVQHCPEFQILHCRFRLHISGQLELEFPGLESVQLTSV